MDEGEEGEVDDDDEAAVLSPFELPPEEDSLGVDDEDDSEDAAGADSDERSLEEAVDEDDELERLSFL